MQKNLIIPKDSGKQDHIFLTTDWLKQPYMKWKGKLNSQGDRGCTNIQFKIVNI